LVVEERAVEERGRWRWRGEVFDERLLRRDSLVYYYTV